jgi:type III pantothenate kinase
MINQTTVLAIDAGNTVLKVAVFQKGELILVKRFSQNESEELNVLKKAYENVSCILSSVRSEEETKKISLLFTDCFIVNHSSSFPIKFAYKTLETLGIDRICNAVALTSICPNQKAVSIDIGTCIKFDFVDENGIYQGGSISPGIQLRYKSLNDYTANLPLIHNRAATPLVGMTTIESIQTGVLNGIQAEIIHLIDRYMVEYGDLTFFMSGGDAQYFDIPRKNNIFVDENLTLKGLYQIFLFNAH